VTSLGSVDILWTSGERSATWKCQAGKGIGGCTIEAGWDGDNGHAFDNVGCEWQWCHCGNLYGDRELGASKSIMMRGDLTAGYNTTSKSISSKPISTSLSLWHPNPYSPSGLFQRHLQASISCSAAVYCRTLRSLGTKHPTFL